MAAIEKAFDGNEKIETGSYRNQASQGSQWEPDDVNEKQVIRKADWHILPLLFSAYFLQFMDKIVLNYANVMGLQRDLKMVGNDFSWAGTIFFIAYGLAEFPQGALLSSFDRST
jgi:sugar phosphate permease